MHACPFQPLHPPSRRCMRPRWTKHPSGSCCEATSACNRVHSACGIGLALGLPPPMVGIMAPLQQLWLALQGSEQAAASGRSLRCMHWWIGLRFVRFSSNFTLICFALVCRPAAAPSAVELFSPLVVAGQRRRLWPVLRCCKVAFHLLHGPRLRIGQHWHIHAVRHCAVAPASLCLTACQAAVRRCCPHRGAA